MGGHLCLKQRDWTLNKQLFVGCEVHTVVNSEGYVLVGRNTVQLLVACLANSLILEIDTACQALSELHSITTQDTYPSHFILFMIDIKVRGLHPGPTTFDIACCFFVLVVTCGSC
jgi:hypothetical protein